MSILSKETVQLSAPAMRKEEAVRRAGLLLVKAGCIAPAYVDGMLAREETMSTYIGQGVAIPHGRLDDLKLVRRSGVSVVQSPAGVAWNAAETAHLIIGLAATSGEYIRSILSNLFEVLMEPEAIERLVHTTDPMVIVDRLNRPPKALDG